MQFDDLPPLMFATGAQTKTYRRMHKLSQAEFWDAAQVTQSGDCRYESGRRIPAYLQILLHLLYAPKAEAAGLLAWLRERRPPHATPSEIPEVGVSDGLIVGAYRKRTGLPQWQFWGAVTISQPGGFRYETGREMPNQIPLLLCLVFGSDEQAHSLLASLRLNSARCVPLPC